MFLETFNKENNEQLLNAAHDSINKKFSADRGKAITDCLIRISEPYLYDFSVEKILSDLLIRDIDEFCEKQEITTIQEFETAVINFTKLFCIKMNDINEPLF